MFSANSGGFLGRSLISAVSLISILGMFMPVSAFALNGTTITSVTLNGSSVATVAPSATVTVSITANRSGNGDSNDWESSQYKIDSGSYVCVNTPDFTSDGNHTDTATFTITAPASPGNHSVSVKVFKQDSCNSEQNSFVGTNNLIVASPDVTPPTFSNVPANITTEATGASGKSVTYTLPTANDANPAHPTVSCLPASGSVFPIASTTVTCSATDTAGNTGTATFTVKVQDTTAPTIAQHANIGPLEATGPTGATSVFTVNAVDTVDGTLAATCVPASGSMFALGTTAVHCNKTDTHGNTATQMSFNVNVVDTTAPTIHLIGGATLSLHIGDSYVEQGATASDLVDGTDTVTIGGWSGDTSHIGTFTVTYDAQDSHGNAAHATRSVSVSDVTAPVITVPTDITKEADGPTGSIVDFVLSALDDADGDVTANLSCTSLSGILFAIGITNVACHVPDSSGNVGTNSFSITVHDTTAPVVIVTPATQTIEATGSSGALATFSVSANDTVDGNISGSATCDHNSGDTFPLGNTTITCSATDAHGNTGSGTAMVHVVDTTKPIVTLLGDAAIGVNQNDVFVDPGATAHDIVDGDIAVNVVSTVNTYNVGGQTITYTATDAAGNVSDPVVRAINVTGPVNALGHAASGSSGSAAPSEASEAPKAPEATTTTVLPVTPADDAGSVLGTSCVKLTSYIGRGKNNPDDVKLLQNFLNKEMGLSLAVNGIYDTPTKAAVNAFQLKYWKDILFPWMKFGHSGKDATGYVYKTTQRMINVLSCPGIEIPMPVLP